MQSPSPDIVGRMHKFTCPKVRAKRDKYIRDMTEQYVSQVDIAKALGLSPYTINDYVIRHKIKAAPRITSLTPRQFNAVGYRLGTIGAEFWTLELVQQITIADRAHREGKTVTKYLVDHFLKTAQL